MPSDILVDDVTHRYPPRRVRRGQRTDAPPSEQAAADRPALDHLSLDVTSGQIYGLLGPNGGGKTTLFRLLATLMPPQAGRITIASHDLATNPDAVRATIGVTFQHASLDKRLTVFENLMHQGHLYALSGRPLSQRIEAALKIVGLVDRRDDLCETLSGGMQRRVEVAKGLLHQPRVLLLDEPSTGLDPGARLDLWQALLQLRESGMTILLTTHLMDEAARCDRLGIIHEGRLVATGSPASLQGELGGSVIFVEADELEQTKTELLQMVKSGVTRVGTQLRLTTSDGPALVARIAQQLGPRLRSISLSQPTLEDVFVARTGRTFWEERP